MFGVYVHFPFCRARCPYCDFSTDVRAAIPHEAYAEAVIAELRAREPLFAGRRARTLYFGGGTPGLWRPDCVARVVRAVSGAFGEPEEITVEFNPGETDDAGMRALRAAGVTRASLGLQSLDDGTLRALARLHDAAAGREAVHAARAAGFASVSCDLLFGLPGQPLDAWRRDLDALRGLAPDHVSVYALTIEPGTPFGQLHLRGRLPPLDEDLQADLYEEAIDVLSAAGYEHYEVSSFARPRHRSRHNTLYWTGGEYLGLGAAAHSRRALPGGASERFANPAATDAWLAEPGALAMRERLDAEATRREALWLGLRLREGLPGERLADAPLRRVADELVRAGLAEERNGRFVLTRRGLLLGDAVAGRLLQSSFEDRRAAPAAPGLPSRSHAVRIRAGHTEEMT